MLKSVGQSSRSLLEWLRFEVFVVNIGWRLLCFRNSMVATQQVQKFPQLPYNPVNTGSKMERGH